MTTQSHKKPLILASVSPYRRELLERLGLPFETAAPGVDETRAPGEPAPELVRRLAEAGFEPGDFKPVYVLRRVTNYIAFSLDTPQALVEAWQHCLTQIRQDGTYGRIARRYNVEVQP